MPASRWTAPNALQRIVESGKKPKNHMPFTPRAKRVPEHALRASAQRGSATLGSGDLLIGLLREPDGVTVHVIPEHDVDIAVLEERATQR